MNHNQLFKQQLSQLCQTVLIFQNYIQPLREILFVKYNITDEILWKIMFGDRIQPITYQQLYTSIKICKSNAGISVEECKNIVKRYSCYQDQRITINDLWHIFRPKTLQKIQSVIKLRKNKHIMSKLIQIDFRAKQLIVSILQKTSQFQKLCIKMKQNIAQYSQQYKSFSLQKIQAKYLHIYLIQYLPQISIKECQIIIDHIVAKHKNRQKLFYIFFLPDVKMKVGQIKNPMQTVQLKQVQDISNLQFYKKNKWIWHYGRRYQKHTKPIYLL